MTKLSRRKKTSLAVVGMGLATGFAAVLLWPYLKRLTVNPTINVLPPTVTRASIGALYRGVL